MLSQSPGCLNQAGPGPALCSTQLPRPTATRWCVCMLHSSYQKRIRPHPSFLPSWEGKLKNATTPSPGVTETESSCPTFPDRGMGSEPERPRGRRLPWHLNQERIRENVKTGASVPGQQQLGCVACLVHEVPMLVPLRSYLLLCIQLWPLFSSSFHTESGSLSPFCRCKQ